MYPRATNDIPEQTLCEKRMLFTAKRQSAVPPLNVCIVLHQLLLALKLRKN